jgi:hypothetical protein
MDSRAKAPRLFVLLPHKEGAFDHRRPLTALSQIEDFKRGIPERNSN